MNIQEHAQLLERLDKLARHVSMLQARIEVLESENRGRRTEDRKPVPAPRVQRASRG